MFIRRILLAFTVSYGRDHVYSYVIDFLLEWQLLSVNRIMIRNDAIMANHVAETLVIHSLPAAYAYLYPTDLLKLGERRPCTHQ